MQLDSGKLWQCFKARCLQARKLWRAIRQHKTNGDMHQRLCQLFQQVMREGIHPLQIFHHNERWLLLCCGFQAVF